MGKRTRPFDERREKTAVKPGNRPVEQQERNEASVDSTRHSKIAITGEGAADFLTASGGLDVPESGSGKDMSQRAEGLLSDPKRLVPRLGPDSEAHPAERAPDEDKPGSATGTIGGGGPDAHNRSAVRATGVDDPTVERQETSTPESKGEKK